MLCLISFFPQVSLALSQPKAQVSTTTMYNITRLLRVYVFNVVIIYLFVGEKYRSYHSIPTFDFPALNFFFPDVCKTFGSGIMQTFNGTRFHVKSTCPVTLTHFSHAGVDCFISVQRDPTGFMKRVEIIVNKVATIIQDGTLTVEGNRYLEEKNDKLIQLSFLNQTEC